jgi:hypothetical protein
MKTMDLLKNTYPASTQLFKEPLIKTGQNKLIFKIIKLKAGNPLNGRAFACVS